MRWVLKCDNQYLVLTESYKVWLEDLYFLAETLLSAQLGHNVFVNKKKQQQQKCLTTKQQKCLTHSWHKQQMIFRYFFI